MSAIDPDIKTLEGIRAELMSVDRTPDVEKKLRAISRQIDRVEQANAEQETNTESSVS